MFPLVLNVWPDVGDPKSWQFFDKLEGKHLYTCKKDIEHYLDPNYVNQQRCPYDKDEVKLLGEYKCVQCELA